MDIAQISYGRLVAYLASVTSDLASAEDALSEAFLAALRTWPERGVPSRPDSWLITAARRSLIDASRRRAVAARALPEIARLLGQSADLVATEDGSGIPDKRLELMFVCTHPAIDPNIRAALMLQTVLGLDAARIGSAYLVAPTTMGQRLSRAKKKVQAAAVPFSIPEPKDLPLRVSAVLDAIYGAYNAGWDDLDSGPPPSDGKSVGLVREALRLARLLAGLLPNEGEVHGLLALMLHSDARSAARRGPDGSFVPLDLQDVHRWSRSDIEEAEQHLAIALSLREIGPYQLHAAIQSVHNRRAASGTTDWVAIAALYEGLVTIAPTVGAHVALAKARTHTHGPLAGVALLDELPPDRVVTYQPYWVVRAFCLRKMQDATASKTAAEQAIALTADPAVRAFLSAEYLSVISSGRQFR